MNCRERLEAYLRANGVPFEVQHHPLVYTAHEVAASEHVLATQMAKVVMVVADGVLAMLVVPSSRKIDEAATAATLDVQEVRLAGEHEFEHAFPDCEVGAMPPFGNLYDIPVYVDRALAEEGRIVFNAGTHTETIACSYVDFERLVKPTAGELTAASLIPVM
ncbi:MAG: YbaK/EbsC family protein [Chloroflexota bacterium]